MLRGTAKKKKKSWIQMCLCNRAGGLVAHCTRKPKYHFGQFFFLLKEKDFIAWQPSKEWSQSILKEINLELFIGRTDVEAEAPILWPPDGKMDSLGKPLMLGNIESKRRGQQRMRWLDSIINSMNMSLSKVGDSEGREGRHSVVHGVSKCWTRSVIEQQEEGRQEAKFRSVSPTACDRDV